MQRGYRRDMSNGQDQDGDVRTQTSRGRNYLLSAGALFVILLLGFAFTSSYVSALHHPKPHQVPVAVAGPSKAVSQAKQTMGDGEALDVQAKSDAGSARQAIKDRQVYGALVLGQNSDRLILADAAGPKVTSKIQQTVAQQEKQHGRQLETEHTHRLQSGDFQGLSSFYAVVGWAFAGYVAAIVLSFVVGPAPLTARRGGLRIAALAGYAVLSGLLGAIAVDPILGAIGGHFMELWAIGAFTTAAAGMATAALQALLSMGGTLLALLAFVVVGNPSAGGVFAPELLPAFFRAVGGWLPNGAGVDALRSLVYFDGAALTQPLSVLAGYVVVAGLVLAVVGRLRTRPPRFRVTTQVD